MSDLHGLDPNTPILVGVGTAVRPDVDGPEVEPIDLMVEAARAALADVGGGPGLVERVGSVAVPVGNWSYSDPGRLVADRLGATGAVTVRVEIGVPQQTPVRVAVERIRSGELDVAIVVGGEAKATQLRRSRAGLEVHEVDQGSAEPDERWAPEGEIVSQAEIDAGMWQPVEQYAAIDNALRAAEGATLDEQLDETAQLWRRFNEIAGKFPEAAFPEPRDARSCARRDRGTGHSPFRTRSCTAPSGRSTRQATWLLCSVGVGRALGIPEDRWVFPQVLVESSLSMPLSKRRDLHRWPAMQVLGAAAAAHLGRPLTSLGHT